MTLSLLQLNVDLKLQQYNIQYKMVIMLTSSGQIVSQSPGRSVKSTSSGQIVSQSPGRSVKSTSSGQIVSQSPGRSVKSNTIKLVFVTSPLSVQHLGERAKTGWFGIGIMRPSGATCLPVDCCHSELALQKYM